MSYYSKAREYHERGQYEEAYNLYKKGIDAEEEKCYYGIAVFLNYGYYVEKNETEAEKIFASHFAAILALAENGDAEAQVLVFYYFKNGFGKCSKNKSIALEWCCKAADQRNVTALYLLGQSYHYGDGVKINMQEAECYYTMAAEENADKQFLLGCLYRSGKASFFRDPKKAHQWIRRAAQGGNANAQFSLCGMYLNGEGCEKNADQALFWCSRAAEQGHKEAKNALEQLTYANIVQKNDYSSDYTLDRLKEMADVQYPGAREMLIKAYLDKANVLSKGDAVEDLLRAADMYEYVVDYGEEYRQLYSGLLAQIYYQIAERLSIEELTSSMPEKAFAFYRKADALGYHKAKFRMALMLYEGTGVERDFAQAIYNFKKCTELGIEEGQSHYYIGNCFFWGLGVPKDYKIANNHYTTAMEYGYSCQYANNMAAGKRGEYYCQCGMRSYAEAMIKANVPVNMLNKRISADLSVDFGECWNNLQENSKIALATGVSAFVSLIAQGEEQFESCDFSVVIMPMAKALEIELAEIFFKGYIQYLKHKGVSPSSFSRRMCIVETRIEGSRSVSNYTDSEKTFLFSLGSLPYILGTRPVKDSQSHVDRQILEYLDFLFSAEAFDSSKRREEIQKYIIRFADDIYTIKSYRNPAAHANVMSCKEAEICGDYLIKVRKLICDLISKIKPIYRGGHISFS